jgi:glycosyltransferase involved in cell wall biosynthesis
MRIIVDLQGAQTQSRFRGIGRYSISLTQALARAAHNHELWIVLNGRFEDTVEPLRAAFNGLVDQDHIVVFDIPGPVAEENPRNAWRARAAEYVREHCLAEFQSDIVYTTSLFEGFGRGDNASTSVGLLNSPAISAVTLYDLIPLRRVDILTNEQAVHWYNRKLASLKRADLLLAISQSSRQEAIRELGFNEADVVNISSAADEKFRRLELRTEQAQDTLTKFCIERPFLLHGSGFGPHKNLEKLLDAFALLPVDLKMHYQLVVTGKIPQGMPEQLLSKAKRIGLTSNQCLFTGYVNDDDLVRLYNLCSLFVCPSLHEGFGLPALEAMSCGAPVIGSNITSIPEVIGRQDALFDPTNPHSIANKIAEVLANPLFSQSLRDHGIEQAKTFSWEASASRVIGAFEEKHARRQSTVCNSNTVARVRQRLAYVPPVPSISSHLDPNTEAMVHELSSFYDVEVIVDREELSDRFVEGSIPVRASAWFAANTNRYQRILYQVENSPFCRCGLELLEKHPGVLVLNDFFLGEALESLDEDRVHPYRFREALYASHGCASLLQAQEDLQKAKLRFPANKRVLDQAAGVIVHSRLFKQWGTDWYGKRYAEAWRLLPQPFSLPKTQDSALAKEELGFDKNDFLVCSFDTIDDLDSCQKLIDAWLMSRLSKETRCHLAFICGNHAKKHAIELFARIESVCSANERIHIVNCASGDVMASYLSAASIAVQFRSRAGSDTFTIELACLAFGKPTIVNVDGCTTEIQDELLVKIPVEFHHSELAAAMNRLWDDPAYCEEISRQSIEHVRSAHEPAGIAEMYADAIEHFAKTGMAARESTCINQIAQLVEGGNPSEQDILKTALAIVRNRRPKGPPKLMIDISTLVMADARSGIQRVVRSVLLELLNSPPDGYSVEPIYFDGRCYRYAREFLKRFLGFDDAFMKDEVLETENRDVFLGLDLAAEAIGLNAEPLIRQMRRRGAYVCFVVYDLLPVLRPEDFPPVTAWRIPKWLHAIGRLSDGLVCISKATADDMWNWLNINQPQRHDTLRIGAFHLGADITASVPDSGLPDNGEPVLAQCSQRPSFLMVGTIEPRKGYRQTLAAFEMLWSQGWDINLMIVGKSGWKVESLVESIRSHPEVRKRLHFLEGVSDEMLLRLYEQSTALLMPSEAEGFGLPLIEAAQHKLPIIARDLPVFKEIAGEHAYYFHGTEPEHLAVAICDWIGLQRSGSVPDSSGMPWLTWKQSTAQLLDAILGGNYFAEWTPQSRERSVGQGTE